MGRNVGGCLEKSEGMYMLCAFQEDRVGTI